MPAIPTRSSRLVGLDESPPSGYRGGSALERRDIVARARLVEELHGMFRPEKALSVVIGIDASLTNTGVICLDLQGQLVHEFNIRPKRTGVDRLREIQQELEVAFLQIRGRPVAHVCMEQYGFAANSQHAFLGEGGGAIKLQCLESLGDPTGYPTLVTPNQLKKFVANKGTAKKEEMLLHVYKKWGYETSDNNLADAYGLARIALSLVTDRTASQYERDVIDKLLLHTERDIYGQSTSENPGRKVLGSSSSRQKR